ncbi:MAG TPA: hypothetical protein VFW85_01860 [Gaiellaceae bacterium]|nr:hypothetical protein [Gaiellaceae bacterium]
MRRLRWNAPASASSKHRLRDTLLLYGGFSLVILILGVALGRGVGRTLAIAAAVFVLSSLWAIYRLRRHP